MRAIITGSQKISRGAAYFGVGQGMGALAKRGVLVTEIITGGSSGVENFVKYIGAQYGLPVTVIKCDFVRYTWRTAVMARNFEMVKKADAVIAVWDGQRDSIKQLLKMAVAKGLAIETYRHDLGPAQEDGAAQEPLLKFRNLGHQD